jgi:hypothetical protein
VTQKRKVSSKKLTQLAEGDDFEFALQPDGSVSLSMGPISIQLTFDAAHDLLFRMANFISSVEQNQDHVLSSWPKHYLDS